MADIIENIKTNKNITETHLYSDVCSLIEQSKTQVAISVNATMSMLYWQIGRRINAEIEGTNRTESYGKEIVATLWRQLSEEYGTAFSEKNLRRMMQFAQTFPDEKIVVPLIRQLSWSHIKLLIPVKDELSREFYIEMCKIERWSVRTLSDKIDKMLYERVALSKKPEDVIKQELALLKNEQQMTADMVFKDPYFLEFLNLKGAFLEKDLENAILAQMQNFIIELGSDFAFMARQKRISIDAEDYYLDLQFFHRRLRCIVAIELKLGKFKPAHKGQMELYLRWLEKNEMLESENRPIGLILCSEGNTEHIEYLMLDESNIKVAQYYTQLPDKKLLAEKLHKAIAIARENFEENKLNNTNK